MKYNSPYSTAAWGMQAKDWEQGIDYSRMSKERLARAQAAIRYAGLGAVLCFNFDNIRYVTSTHIGEWARDKFFRYALCPAEGKPFLWDPAPPAKRLSSPWIKDNVAAPITTMQGAIPPGLNVQHDFAKQIKKALVHYGIEKEPLGVDLMELGMLRALEAEGRRLLLEEPGVVAVFARGDLERGAVPPEAPFAAAIYRTTYPGRSPDLQVVIKPYWLAETLGTRSTTHGSPHPYDTHVPILFWGPRWLGTGRVEARVEVADIAPTLARLLGVPVPAQSEGKPLPLPAR